MNCPTTLILAAVLAWGAAQTVRACAYNVRDLGFIDLESESYRMYVFAATSSPPADGVRLEQLAASVFADCNVEMETVNLDAAPQHSARKYLSDMAGLSRPVGVMVSPDGQRLVFQLPSIGSGTANELVALLESVVTSPTRAALLRAVSRDFAAILLIEGSDTARNQRARSQVSQAIDAVKRQLPAMPKQAANAPAMIAIEKTNLERERILLWSLGLDPQPESEPRAAVIYGRARWIGPLMKGQEITSLNLTRLISIVGADCECGFDVAWTLGTRLLVRWDQTTHAVATKTLGFDPENPVVKAEISRIVRRDSSSISTAGSRSDTASGQPIAHVGFSAQQSNRLASDATSSEPRRANVVGPPPQKGTAVGLRALMGLGILAGITVPAGLLIVWIRRR